MSAALTPLLEAIERSCRQRCEHLLTLVDRSPYAITYGCFDRSFWQYKIKDFPSGMSQEALYPLALALELGLFAELTPPSAAALERLIHGAAAFSLGRQHRNGSVDDYFPYEQAAGATAFSAFAILQTLALDRLALSPALELRLRRRVRWLARHRESGRLSNHEALISLCLARAGLRWDDPELLAAAAERSERLLSWRSEEGWFEEYGGFDVGYETLTFAALVELASLAPRFAAPITPILDRQFELIVTSAEPDGCLGGELFSRGTWNLFAHGLVAHALEQPSDRLGFLLPILEARFLRLPTEVRDDYVLQHHLWSDLRTLQLLRRAVDLPLPAPRPQPAPAPAPVTVLRVLPQAGHVWVRHGRFQTHVSMGVGGGFRLYRDRGFLTQDTQLAVQCGGRKPRCWLANAPGALVGWEWQEGGKVLLLRGRLSAYRPQPMTTLRLLVLRVLMLAGGRWFADPIRALMQRLLIHAAADPHRWYERRFRFLDDGLRVEDRYGLPGGEAAAATLTPTSFSTFRHVVMSRVFHPYLLQVQDPSETRFQRLPGELQLERRW